MIRLPDLVAACDTGQEEAHLGTDNRLARLGSQEPRGIRALTRMNNPYPHETHRYDWTGQHSDDVYDRGQNWVEGSMVHRSSGWSESHQGPLHANVSGQEWDSVAVSGVGYNYSYPSGSSHSPLGHATTHSLLGANNDRSQVLTDGPRTMFTPGGAHRIQASNLR
jgi:hypothetical protein